MNADYPLQYSSITTTDTNITTTPAYYYGATVVASATATAVLIREGAAGTIIDSFEVPSNRSEPHMLPIPIKVSALTADVDANTQQCIVYYHEES